MYNKDTELIFPPRVLPALSRLRGEVWQTLVNSILEEPVPSRRRQGFVLFMVHLAGCLTCDWESYRALQGCTECSRGVIRRFRGSDHDLCALYEQAQEKIDAIHDRGEN